MTSGPVIVPDLGGFFSGLNITEEENLFQPEHILSDFLQTGTPQKFYFFGILMRIIKLMVLKLSMKPDYNHVKSFFFIHLEFHINTDPCRCRRASAEQMWF